jgi:site-specific DNA-cytosine methylase
LAALGYDCKWGVLGAADVGGHHKRERIWIVASDSMRVRAGGGSHARKPVKPDETIERMDQGQTRTGAQ